MAANEDFKSNMIFQEYAGGAVGGFGSEHWQGHAMRWIRVGSPLGGQ